MARRSTREEELEHTFPGVTAWFDLRREANLLREAEAMKALERAPSGTAVDVPIAGADWPYGEALDVDALETLSERTGADPQDWRIYTTPDPPGTLLRTRVHDHIHRRQLDFARALTGYARDREERAKINATEGPFAAHCAKFASTVTSTRWMAAYSPSGLAPSAPPDAIATGLAAYVSALVAKLPRFHYSRWPGRREHDLLLPAAIDARTARGRWCLDHIIALVANNAADARTHWPIGPTALAPPRDDQARGHPELSEPMRWRIPGWDSPEQTRREEWNTEIHRIVTQSNDQRTPPEQPDPGPNAKDETYLGRLGLGITWSLSRLAPNAAPDETAMALAAEHGLSVGHDARSLWWTAALRKHSAQEANDCRLALERLRHIEGDPCAAAHPLQLWR